VNVIIRDAVEADLPAITEIYNAAIASRVATAQLEPVTLEQQRNSLGEHSPERYPFWVAEINGRVIGWLSFRAFLPRCAYRGTAEISVYVDEKSRRRGVAQQLLQEAIARAPSLGITALVGLIFGHNEPSLKLFERLGFQRWGLLPGIARMANDERDLIVMGRHCPTRRGTTTECAAEPLETSNQLHECLNLMHTLMEYRHKPIHSRMLKIRDRYSMLHLDVLLLIYHFAKVCPRHILEIGAFVGGATIAAAFGVRDSGKRKMLITIEPGGSVRHKRLGTRDILRDLKRNLARERVSELVTLIEGRSFDPATISAVNETLDRDKIGLLILDADAAKRRDIDRYRGKFAEGCWMVIDDYYGADANAKITPSRADVDALTATGYLEPLGFYGWSTWVGRWLGAATQGGLVEEVTILKTTRPF